MLANGCNLDRKNPRAKKGITHLSADELAERILEKERRIEDTMRNVHRLLDATR